MKKYNKLFAILFAVLGMTTLKAQEWTDKTSLLANPSFENETTATNLGSGKNGWGGPTGWILSPSTAPSNSQSGAIASSCNIQGIATTFPTADGGNYFYVRTNWNNNVTFSLSQEVSGELPAGLYRLTCKAASNSGNWSTSKFSLTLKEGDGNVSTNSSLNKCSAWTEWTIDLYKNDPSTSLTIEATMYPGSSGSGQHYQMLLDDFKLEYMSFDDIEAAGWPKPQVPGSNLKSFVGTSVVAAMYNVGSDAFVTRGMTWGTQAIATKLHNSDSQTQATSDRHHVKVSAGDGDLVKFTVNGKNYLGDGGQGTTTTVYTDNGNTNTNQFIYSQFNEGTYKLKVKNATSDENAFLDVAQPYGGQLTYANGQGFTEWAIIKFSDIENGKYASYKAKRAMYEVYKAVVDAGHSATYSDALSTALKTYIKPNATASDVTTATNVLINAVSPALTAGYVNAGALFTNPDMRGAGTKADWTSGYTNLSWGVFENYHTNHGDRKLTQTKVVPNGFYKVVFHGIWRQDGSDAAPALTLRSGDNSVSANVPCMTDIAFGVTNTNGSNDWTNNNGKIIPNGMQSAGEGLSHGSAQVTISDFVVSDGQLTIEMNSSSTSQWILAQGFDIYFKAESLEEYANLFYAAKSAAEAIDQNTLNTYAKNTLTTALNNAATEQIDKAWYQEHTAALNNAVTIANDIATTYPKTSALLTICNDILDNSVEFEDGAKETFSGIVSTASENVAIAQTSAAINDIYNTLEAARQTYVKKADPTNGTYFDYTFLVTNPGFDNDKEGWTSTGGAQNKAIATNKTNGIITGKFYENWNGSAFTGEIYQTVSNLPSGIYKLKIAAFGAGTNVYANDLQTAVTTGDGAWYEVDQVKAGDGTLKFGIKNENAATWMGIDNASVYYYGFDAATAQNSVANLKAEAEDLVGKPMNAEVATALDEAITGADATKTTRNELNSMIDELNTAIASAKASVAEYEKIAGYIAKANKIDESIAAEIQTLYNSSTLGEAEPVFQALEVATYNYVTENFNYAVPISSTWNSTGTNTSAKEFNNEHWSGETRGYMNQNDDNGQGWNANAWSLDFDQDVTLPAGEYVFKVAGRKSADATLELVVTMGETTLGTVSDFPNGSTGRGINKAGAASFDPNDQFTRPENTGFGWQWRYVKFALNEEATVKIAVHAETNVLHNWVSFGDYTLQMTEETYLEANMGALDAPTAAAEALVDTKPMGTAENNALKAALALPVTTGAELLAKIEALNIAVANANAWIPKYNEAKDPLVAALERFETDYNDGANGCLYHLQKAAWSTVIEKVQAAAEAKDVTDSYDGFEAATTDLVAALDAAQASINMYAKLKAEIAYAQAYTPLIEGNAADHTAAITAAQNAYDAAETADASELILAMQNYKVLDYTYVTDTYSASYNLGNWTGSTGTGKSEHWSGNAETTYFDYSRWSGEAKAYEATQTITLPAGEYVLMAAGRASEVEGTEAYIKVDDNKVSFNTKGSYGLGIDTDGKANFSADGTYGRDGEGYGWEYRFIEFTLTEETEVTLVAGMNIADSHNPLSWAGVCTPQLFTTPLSRAKNNLQKAIDAAEATLAAYPIGEEAFQISEYSDAYKVLSQAIVTAKGYLGESNIGILEEATETLNAAVETFETSYVLNDPKEGEAFNMVLNSNGGWQHDGKAVTYIANGRNDAGNYNIQYLTAPNVNYAQAFTFTPVADRPNHYTLSMTDVDGNQRYVCTGVVYGGNTSQIRTTIEPASALVVKVIATKSEVYNLYNTEASNYIGSQDNGFFTVNSHINFNLVAAEKANVTLTISAGWATLILPFHAEIPEGVRAFSCSGSDEDNVLALTEATGTFAANTPYLVSGTGKHVFSGYGLAKQDSYKDGLFTGTYVEYQTTANSNTYVLQKHDDEVAFYLVGESVQPVVNPYRMYMTYEKAAGAPMFRIGRGTTGIEDAEWTMDNGQLTIYDLMGRKVTTMEKGNMYIVNGKKVVIK